ncbi:MAG: hypothetical protein IH597_08565 [Bacteroidales bacterium]|nr:hypothetical protein [Bacteroidales bacterium]
MLLAKKRMKHYLILILVTLSFSVEGQKSIYLYFNDAGFCGPGPLYIEELTLFEDNSFEYTSFQYLNLKIEASGQFLKGKKYISLEYQVLKIDTLNKSKEIGEINNLQFISKFRIIKDKDWLKNKGGMLIECGKLFASKTKMLEPRKRRVMIIKTFDYKLIN